MFRGLRLNLTGKFLLLSVLVYLFLSTASVLFFHYGLTEYLDEELHEIYTLILPSIVIKTDGSVLLPPPPRQMSLKDIVVAPSVSLFGTNKELIHQHGIGSSKLLATGQEDKLGALNYRTLSQALYQNGKTVAYLQIQINTREREQAVREYLEAVITTAPLLLLALSAAGYFFASRAVKPVEETFATLKQFMSDAGHELKTPIAVIHATCDNLSADLEGNTEACERVAVISRSADRMQRLVADLLLLTKSEQAAVSLKMLPLRFDMLLREVLGEFSDLFEEKNIELAADTIQNAKVNGDKYSLHRLVANLLENALNYTESGGKVTVSLTVSGSNLHLKVADSGIGIPEEALKKIFERFYRVDQSRSRAQGGSGLGLAIVKAISEAHHGQVSVTSEVGKGTSFMITIPVVGQTSLFRIGKPPDQ